MCEDCKLMEARDRVRRIANRAMDEYLEKVFDTPKDTPLFVENLFDAMKSVVVPVVREYRARLR
ncbi:MAG TPA: hypothetical protein VMU12_02950 [Candidatus Paceibacterota bacterium]|nr:hypothetical protein [Candidatus Paceibacterota bacterium]